MEVLTISYATWEVFLDNNEPARAKRRLTRAMTDGIKGSFVTMCNFTRNPIDPPRKKGFPMGSPFLANAQEN
jgi:hypothetical protein